MVRDGNGATATRRRNTATCWAMLRELGETSIARLVNRVELSRPTTQAIMRDLAERGLATQVPGHSGRPGRPGERYVFEPLALAMACLDLDRDGTVTTARIGLDGEMAEIRSMGPVPGVDLTSSWTSRVEEMLPEGPLDVLVVSMPGIVDPSGTVIRVNSAPEWADQDIRDLLPVPEVKVLVVENHVNMAAFAEARMGAGHTTSSLLYLQIAQGLKAAIVLHGRLHRGEFFSAGEGTRLIEQDWPPGPGQLTPTSVVQSLTDLSAKPLSVMIGMLDPAVVVVAGPGAQLGGNQFLDELRSSVGLELSGRTVPVITTGTLGRNAPLYGSAIRAIEIGTQQALDGESVASPTPWMKEAT